MSKYLANSTKWGNQLHKTRLNRVEDEGEGSDVGKIMQVHTNIDAQRHFYDTGDEEARPFYAIKDINGIGFASGNDFEMTDVKYRSTSSKTSYSTMWKALEREKLEIGRHANPKGAKSEDGSTLGRGLTYHWQGTLSAGVHKDVPTEGYQQVSGHPLNIAQVLQRDHGITFDKSEEDHARFSDLGRESGSPGGMVEVLGHDNKDNPILGKLVHQDEIDTIRMTSDNGTWYKPKEGQ